MTPDPSFLFLTPAHREALAGLTYAVTHRKGFVVLTGDAGTGKTTLLTRMQQTIPSTQSVFSVISNPTLTPSEFLELALLDFGIDDVPLSKAQRLLKLQYFLVGARSRGKVAILVVDEAQRLPLEVLEEIRLLSNFEGADQKLIQIVLAGQNELADVLNQNSLRQLKQRIAVRLGIHALTVVEVEQYIKHRWVIAGAKDPIPFDMDAIQRIAQWSQGIPRTINAICDNALLLAYGKRATLVSADHVFEVSKDLDLLRSGTSYVEKLHAVQNVVPVHPIGSSPKNGHEPLVSMPSLDRYADAGSKSSRLMKWMGKLGLAS